MIATKGIEEIIAKRRIKHLVHFTRAENLPSIFANGLCPRIFLNEENAIFNDEYRYDDCTDAVCLSISFPNYKMFFSLREKDRNARWAVLLIDSSVLVKYPCAFCEMNAASAAMFNTPIKERAGCSAFERLFANESEGRLRADLGIPDSYPTNPQAEVLLFSMIPIEYITEVQFNNEITRQEYAKAIPSMITTRITDGFFSPRIDYKKW